jgi:hypothetical protein
MVTPSLEDFKRLAGQGNLIPIFEEIHYDLETPLSAFRKIDDGKSSFLLESVERNGVVTVSWAPGPRTSSAVRERILRF